ncbi:histidine--tRNA ligase [candidate division NPL-UPA2 bacterium]|nr:histidine--tRNA ligase [candidate division NPL-UPA2 bacterium]
MRGARDILLEEAEDWSYIEGLARRVLQNYHYREIRTPIFEETDLFVRSIGETSDIVTKQMYTFLDRKGRSITLRPEGTAPVVRAYLEHNLQREGSTTKLFYIGPFFRSERPQAGRGRQFHQIGAEAIGSSDPALDVECISVLLHLFRELELAGVKVRLNSVGCKGCQPKYKEVLLQYLRSKLTSLCSDCRARLERNPLRALDCKKEECRSITHDAPALTGHLCHSCSEHFGEVQAHLDNLKIPYSLDPHLVRGLDYYTRTAFEVTHPDLGAQNALAAGGRFDELIAQMGGNPTPAVGFAAGLERIILAKGGKLTTPSQELIIYLAPAGEKAHRQAVKLLHQLRSRGIRSEMDYEERSLKSQLRLANRLKAKYVAIIGEKEVRKKIVSVKDMTCGGQEEIALNDVVGVVAQKEASVCQIPHRS